MEKQPNLLKVYFALAVVKVIFLILIGLGLCFLVVRVFAWITPAGWTLK